MYLYWSLYSGFLSFASTSSLLPPPLCYLPPFSPLQLCHQGTTQNNLTSGEERVRSVFFIFMRHVLWNIVEPKKISLIYAFLMTKGSNLPYAIGTCLLVGTVKMLWFLFKFLAALGLCCCVRAFSLAVRSGGCSSSWCVGFSCCGAQAPEACARSDAWASVVVARGAPLLWGTWNLPRPGSNPCPLEVTGGLLFSLFPGKSRENVKNTFLTMC